MIGAFIRHGALSSKVRVLYGKRLSNDEMNEMLKKRSVGDIAAFLKETPSYSDALSGINEKLVHRGQLEGIIRKKLFDEYIKIFNFASGTEKTFLKTILMKYEIEQILSFIRFLRAGQPDEFIYSIPEFIIEKSGIDFAKMSKCNNFSEFIAVLENTVFHKILLKYKSDEEINYTDLENVLYSFYYSLLLHKMLPLFSKDIKESLLSSIGSQIDLLNIGRIIRLKEYYHADAKMISEQLIPFYFKLNSALVQEMVNAKNTDEVYEIIKKTLYAKLFADHKFTYIEQYEYEIVLEISKAAMRRGTPSVSIPIAYFNIKEIEIKNLIAIIEGKRYNMPYEDIKKHLIGI